VYSERLISLFHSRPHAGKLDDATHYGEAGSPGGGPYLRLWLRVVDGRTEAARFQTYGCPAVIACGEALCATVEGEAVGEIGSLSAAQVTDWVGGVPEGKEHCPPLAAGAWNGRRALPR